MTFTSDTVKTVCIAICNWLSKNKWEAGITKKIYCSLPFKGLLCWDLVFSALSLPSEINVCCSDPVVQLHVSDQHDLLVFYCFAVITWRSSWLCSPTTLRTVPSIGLHCFALLVIFFLVNLQDTFNYSGKMWRHWAVGKFWHCGALSLQSSHTWVILILDELFKVCPV